MQLTNRKITNTSARVLSFHAQENAGVDSVPGQVFTGHISEKSVAFYRRANPDMLSLVGAALTSAVTGSKSVFQE